MKENSSFLRGYYSKLWKVEKDDSPNFSRLRAARLIRPLARKLPSNSVYLGIAAGRGVLEKEMWSDALKHFKSVYLLDIADRKPLISRKEAKGKVKYGNVQNVTADSHELPFPDNSVGIISSHMAYDFFDEREKAALEMKRVLKSGGKAIVFLHHPKQEPDAVKGMKKTDGMVFEFWKKLRQQKRLFETEKQVQDHFQELGFHVESVSEHVKENPFDDYWWEVVLKKQAEK